MLPDREIYTPSEGPPQGIPELRHLFGEIGESNLRALVDDFYNEIAISSIAELFPSDLSQAKVHQADFLIQVLGGPSYYLQNRGPARMRARHFQWEINEEKRMVWLGCYTKAIERSSLENKHKEPLVIFLTEFSKWMVNSRS